MTPNIEILSKLIELKSLKIISFDIFDTLILRPVINPRDIMFFLDKYYQEMMKNSEVNISKIRIDCENELIKENGVENITIGMIYERIGSRTNLDENQVNSLREREISLEVDLVCLNLEMFNIFERARKTGKKIILASDMYLTAQEMSLFLNKFSINYETLYISADIKKRKDKGDLYDEIIFKEKVLAHEILHIGDNETSDFLIPIKKGIMAFHYIPDYLSARKYFNYECKFNNKETTSMFLGYLLNEELNLKSEKNAKYTNLYDFGYYCIGPFLLAIILNLLNSPAIQNTYNFLFFSSRDGYLPLKLYELLRKATGKGIPGKYIYCGRRALNIAYFSGNVTEFLSETLFIMDRGFDHITKDLFTNMNLENYFSETKSNSNDGSNIQDCILAPEAISVELEARKNNAKQYFNDMFNSIEREVVFDCGYSGSVSDSILKLTGKKIDKVYLWEEDINKAIDEKNGTKTFLLLENLQFVKPFNLIFEELFSPLEPACIGYEMKNGKAMPVFDSGEYFSDEMKNELSKIQSAAIEYTNRFVSHFASYLRYFDSIDNQAVFDYTMSHLFNEKDESLCLFRNIKFYDRFFEGNNVISLTNKLCEKNKTKPCKGSVLLNPNNLRQNNFDGIQKDFCFKAGLHIHLFQIDLYMSFLEKLIKFPYPFDLYITCHEETNTDMLYNLFSPEVIPNLNTLNVKPVENHGGDVAPWLIEMGSINSRYDFFGHFHSMNSSPDNNFRDYLLENLLSKDSVVDILNLFCLNHSLGIVFPPMYKDTYHAFVAASAAPFNENDVLRDFLAKINLPAIDNYNEILFPVGFMFWYRPIALKKIFSESLSYNDFSLDLNEDNKEFLYTIERLPSYVASNATYDTLLYLSPKLLVDTFYKNYYSNFSLSHPLPELTLSSNLRDSSFRRFCKKAYLGFLKAIPGSQTKKLVSNLIQNKIYHLIRKSEIKEFTDGIHVYRRIIKSELEGLKKIKLNHWVGFSTWSFSWNDRFIHITNAWVIDYIHKNEYKNVFVKVNGVLYSTIDHMPSPDIEKHFRTSNYSNVRFKFTFPLHFMYSGANKFSVIVILNDSLSYYETNMVTIMKNSESGLSVFL